MENFNNRYALDTILRSPNQFDGKKRYLFLRFRLYPRRGLRHYSVDRPQHCGSPTKLCRDNFCVGHSPCHIIPCLR